MFPNKVPLKHIDDRKNELYKKMMDQVLLSRDEKALKKQAAKEVKLLNKELFNKKKKKYDTYYVKTTSIFDEFLHFIEK
jgi:uncharacterized protein with PIN domain